MRYLMLICTDPSAEPYDPEQDNIESWVSEMDGKGIRKAGDPWPGWIKPSPSASGAVRS